MLDRLCFKLSAPYRAHKYFRSAMGVRRHLRRLFEGERGGGGRPTLHERMVEMAHAITYGKNNQGTFDIYVCPWPHHVHLLCNIVDEVHRLIICRALARSSCRHATQQMAIGHHAAPCLLLLSALAVVNRTCAERISQQLIPAYKQLYTAIVTLRPLLPSSPSNSASSIFDIAFAALPSCLGELPWVEEEMEGNRRAINVSADVAHRRRSFTFIRDTLKLEGIDFALRIQRDDIDKARRPAGEGEKGEEEGVVVQRGVDDVQVIDVEDEEEMDAARVFASREEGEEEQHELAVKQYVQQVNDLRDRLSSITSMQDLKALHVWLKGIVVTSKGDKKQYIEHVEYEACAKIVKVRQCIRRRWESLRALKMGKERGRLLTEIAHVKGQCLAYVQ